MSTSGLLSMLFDLLAGSDEYAVIGSLSFLPLTGPYRAPGQDLDVLIRRDIFDARKLAFEAAGQLDVLRLREVAIASASVCSWLLMPKTGFVHLETDEGLLDIALYDETCSSVDLDLGIGLRLSMAPTMLTRVNRLMWQDQVYTAAPPEFTYLTKLAGFWMAMSNGTAQEYELTKHYADLSRMEPIIDEGFTAELRASIRVGWARWVFPGIVQRRVNPFATTEGRPLILGC